MWEGRLHRSVDSCPPSILQSQVRIPSTLLESNFILYLSLYGEKSKKWPPTLLRKIKSAIFTATRHFIQHFNVNDADDDDDCAQKKPIFLQKKLKQRNNTFDLRFYNVDWRASEWRLNESNINSSSIKFYL